MRRTLFILFGLPALLAWGSFSASGLTIAELQQQLAAGGRVTVIDVRRPAAYRQEHIPGAINIPAALCPLKKLPPLGAVVVYGDGLPDDNATAAAAALAAKPGLKVEVLQGGFAGWKSSPGLTTRRPGLKLESFNYITYAHLKAARTEGLILYALRQPARSGAPALTDLNAEFPGLKHAASRADAVRSAADPASLVVLLDSGDGTAELEARRFKLGGAHRYVILAGGEPILARHGEMGLKLNAAGTTGVAHKLSPSGGVK